MPYIPGFDHDLFISYASDDNHGGAVEEFVVTLERHISDNLVNAFSPKEKIRVYFDRQRLTTQTAINWEEHLKAAASSSAILVPFLSPNYLSSSYCTKERDWFSTQRHVAANFPFAVAGWIPVEERLLPVEFDKAQRHHTILGALSPAERIASARELAIKLRDKLVEMRVAVSGVFLGPAAGRGLATRSRVRDELEKSGYRVVPDADYVYDDLEEVRVFLKSALLAIHFPGDDLDVEGLTAMEESFPNARKTLLVQPHGSTLWDDEAATIHEIEAQLGEGGRYAGASYMRLDGKTDDQVWDTVKREVLAARFQKDKSEFTVGVTCELPDLAGAKALAALISALGVPAQYPLFDPASSTPQRMQAFRETITRSPALLCYWAAADGRSLQKQLEQYGRRQYKAKAWYVAPPLDLPAKANLSQMPGMVLQQTAAGMERVTLEPFLRELGWTPA